MFKTVSLILIHGSNNRRVWNFTESLSDGWVNGWMDGRSEERTDGWLDGLLDGWMDKVTDLLIKYFERITSASCLCG